MLATSGAGAGGVKPAAFGAVSREAWPEAEPLGCESPSGKSRRGTPEGVLPLPRGWGGAAARKAAVVTDKRSH